MSAAPALEGIELPDHLNHDMRPGTRIVIGKSRPSARGARPDAPSETTAPAVSDDPQPPSSKTKATRNMPTGPLQLPATVFVHSTTETGERTMIIGKFLWVRWGWNPARFTLWRDQADDRYGNSNFTYKGVKCNAAFVFDFGQHIFVRPTKVRSWRRGSVV